MVDHDHSPVKYEAADVNPRAIVRFGLALIAMTILSAAAVGWIFTALLHRERAGDASPPALAYTEPRLPPEPRLQGAPTRELDEWRREEEQWLREYAWVDKPSGRVHIPIDVAMDLLVRRAAPSNLQASLPPKAHVVGGAQ